jgi:hypothetical protein
MTKDIGDKTMDKLLGKGKIEKLEIDLQTKTDADYHKARASHIKSLVSAGKSKAWAEADFDGDYPDADSWKARHGDTLSSYGQQNVIDKINEIIDRINEDY